MNIKQNVAIFLLWLAIPLLAVSAVGNEREKTAQYIVINFSHPSEKAFQEVAETFKGHGNDSVRIGVGVIISYLAYAPDEAAKRLKNYLSYAEKYDLPLVIQLDGEQWWENRPDLWNWWDPDQPGYNPDNKYNVEWTSWRADDAVKIGWRNWGRQLRVLPMPNLMSPRYRTACHTEMKKLVPMVVSWYRHLPASKKHLFVGLKVGWESSIGVNNWYYPNGNELLVKSEDQDPQYGLTHDSLPARGVTAMGYAAVSTYGLAKSGTLQQEQLTTVVQAHLSDLSKLCAEMGVPRNRLFTHCGGWSQGETLYKAAINEYACPGWSFYDFAGNPLMDTTAMDALQQSNAPFWSAVEWLYNGKNADNWQSALRNTLSIPLIRYLCIYNWEGIKEEEQPVNAIKRYVAETKSE